MPIHIKGSGGSALEMVKCTIGSDNVKGVSMWVPDGQGGSSLLGAMTAGSIIEVPVGIIIYCYVLNPVSGCRFFTDGEGYDVSRDDDAKASCAIMAHGDFTLTYKYD